MSVVGLIATEAHSQDQTVDCKQKAAAGIGNFLLEAPLWALSSTHHDFREPQVTASTPAREGVLCYRLGSEFN